uniref:Uncharacterized protein n=1 Tax=Solanum tuberosum TaxID=4113 RepID=M1BF83_SOLTU
MKKLSKKRTIHLSPPSISNHFSFLPIAILTLVAALFQEDKKSFAYLISCFFGEFVGNRRTIHKFKTTNPTPLLVNFLATFLVTGGVPTRSQQHLTRVLRIPMVVVRIGIVAAWLTI